MYVLFVFVAVCIDLLSAQTEQLESDVSKSFFHLRRIFLHSPPPPTPRYTSVLSRLRTVTSPLPRLTSRTKNIAPSLYALNHYQKVLVPT